MSTPLKIIIAIAVVLLVVLGYYFFFSGPSAGGATLVATKTSTLTPQEEATNADFLHLLRSLKGIDLNRNDLTKNPLFTNLIDYSVTLTPEQAGRENPFAPLAAALKTTTAAALPAAEAPAPAVPATPASAGSQPAPASKSAMSKALSAAAVSRSTTMKTPQVAAPARGGPSIPLPGDASAF